MLKTKKTRFPARDFIHVSVLLQIMDNDQSQGARSIHIVV